MTIYVVDDMAKYQGRHTKFMCKFDDNICDDAIKYAFWTPFQTTTSYVQAC